MSADSMNDAELGDLTWNEQLEWWEGSIRMTSPKEFELFVLARSSLVADRSITADARAAIARIRTAEDACRSYACGELLEIHNSEWSEGSIISAGEFKRRLEPDSVEVHESGYSEVHFRDGDLFWGHSVGVRIRPDGSFQEAVVEG
jgi:hypothetical protein